MEEYIEAALHNAIHYAMVHDNNPYVSKETIVQRVYKTLSKMTRVEPALSSSLFREWHSEILEAYEKKRAKLSHEDRVHVERVLSKDSPPPSELIKFANCWYKQDEPTTRRWFAVDGLLGPHPKSYAFDAFMPAHADHHKAVRALYAYYSDPDTIQQVIEKAFCINNDQPCRSDFDETFENCVGLYAEMVGQEGMKAIEEERSRRLTQQSTKRKAKQEAKPEE